MDKIIITPTVNHLLVIALLRRVDLGDQEAWRALLEFEIDLNRIDRYTRTGK